MPVDHVSAADQRRCSRRQLCVTVLVAACLGVTVCLVIALPLSYRGGGSSGVSTTAGDDETVQVHGLPLPVLMQSENNDVIPRAERTAVARPVFAAVTFIQEAFQAAVTTTIRLQFDRTTTIRRPMLRARPTWYLL